MDRNIRKVIKIGKASLAVTLPKDLMTELKWREKQKVVVKKKGKTLVISDWS